MKPTTTEYPRHIILTSILISICLIFTLLYFGQTILVPLLMSLLLAILLRPIVTIFTKLKIPHSIAVAITVILFVVFITTIIFFISWQISDITNDWNAIKLNLLIHCEHLQHWVEQRYHISYYKQESYLLQLTNQTFNGDSHLMGNTLNSFSNMLFNSALIPFYTFLVLLYRELFLKFLYKVVEQKNQSTLIHILSEVKIVVQSYIVGLLIEMGIVGVLTSASLMLLGVQYAILLGVITAVLNVIPYIGIIVACIISVLATLGNSTDLSIIIGIIISNVIVQLIDNNIVVPKIVGNKVRINSLVTMVGVVIGGAVWGVSGMVFSIPLAAIVKVIFDHIESLKPWGYLLGNIEPHQSKKEKLIIN